MIELKVVAWLFGALMAFWGVIAWCSCVVGKRADELMEKFREEDDE